MLSNRAIAALLLAFEVAIQIRRQRRADERPDDKDPDLGDRTELARKHLRDRRSDRTCRVHRRPRKIDAEQMDQGERQPDHDPRYGFVFRLARDADDGEYERERQDDLHDESHKEPADVTVRNCERRGDFVAAKRPKAALEQSEDQRARKSAEDLA